METKIALAQSRWYDTIGFMFSISSASEEALQRGLGSQFEHSELFGKISELIRIYGEGEGQPLEFRRLPSGLCEVCAEHRSLFGVRGILVVFDDTRRPFAMVGACCYSRPWKISA